MSDQVDQQKSEQDSVLDDPTLCMDCHQDKPVYAGNMDTGYQCRECWLQAGGVPFPQQRNQGTSLLEGRA